MTREPKDRPQNLFELLLRDMALQFDPDKLTLTVRFPTAENHSVDVPIDKTEIDLSGVKGEEEDELDITELDTGVDPVRVKLNLKAYIKLTLHALKYANPKIPQPKWVEVIGLLTGYIENKDTPMACLVVTDAFPIGHGTDITAQINNPQSMVRVFRESSKKKEFILGWYHSHPSYGAFMSDTDYQTQVRYQRLSTSDSPLTAPVALVIDPTRISTRSYGFKIFRLKKDLRTWEEPNFQVLNCPLSGLPDIISTLLPLAEGNTMFLEYDHD